MDRQPVLVTGAGGFVGSRLTRRLVELGYEVAALDCDVVRLGALARTFDVGAVRVIECDITEARALEMAVRSTMPWAIVHLAALHYIPSCEAEPSRAASVNVGGLLNLLAAGDMPFISRFLFASTADVYAPCAHPMREHDALGPTNVYGATKLLGERLVTEWGRMGPDRRTASLRLFNVYGDADRTPHVIPEILNSLAVGESIRLGNLKPARDYIHVDDVANVICSLIGSPELPSVVNIGTGVATSVEGLLATLRELVDVRFDVAEDASKVRRTDRPHLQSDSSLLGYVVPGFVPRSLEVGLRSIVEVLGIPMQGVDGSSRHKGGPTCELT